MQQLYPIIMLAIMFGAMYFLMIRPQKKRQEEMAKVRDTLKIGDTIVTIGGIRGRIVALTEDAFEIETGQEHHRVEFLRNALSYVVQPVAGYEGKKEEGGLHWEGEENTEEADSPASDVPEETTEQ